MGQYLKISAFARLCGITRKNLIFYDEIGLLKPERVEENGYRAYTLRQMEPASVISALREIGMPLSEIKEYLTGRNPAALVALIGAQKKILAAKKDRLNRIDAMLNTRLQLTKCALSATFDSVEVCYLPAQPIFESAQVDCSSEAAAEQAAYDFYDICDNKGLTYGYPLGDIVSKDNLLNGGKLWPSRYFFAYPKTEHNCANALMPQGLYLICYERSYYDYPRRNYTKILDYVKANNYEIVGDIYEMFLLDEIAVQNSEDYAVKISVPIAKRVV